MRSAFSLYAAVLVSCALINRAVVTAQAGATVWDGVYTQAQATRGQTIYKETCQPCHGETLGGTLLAPPLTGDDFMGDWMGKTVGALVKRTQATMPADDPGSLQAQQIADSLAYVFARNNFPAGLRELGSDLAGLNQIRITPKK